MNSVEVSVICTAFNHEKFIQDALEGFVNQKTTFPFEVIVHDDASTDNTAQIIREYEKKYPEVIKPIYQKENQQSKGNNILLNIVLPRIRGKYVALCEGDDFWIDNFKLQKQFDYMESHPECSLVAHKHIEYEVMEDIYYIFPKPGDCDLSAKEIIADQSYFQTASMFFKREHLLLNKSAYDNIGTYDYDEKIMLATEGIVHVMADIMSVYRKGTNGSWTERIGRNNYRLVEHINEKIYSLEKINAYRGYKYDLEIRKSIIYLEIDRQVCLRDKRLFKTKKYAPYIKNMPNKEKIKIFIQVYIPHLYDLILKQKLPTAKRRYKCQPPIS